MLALPKAQDLFKAFWGMGFCIEEMYDYARVRRKGL
jgi:hypothetical protein